MLKTMLKKTLPKWVLDKIISFTRRNAKLFMDNDFLSYVYKKKLGLENNLDNIQTLALRGSHADYSIFAKGENGIYNLGLTSTDIYVNFKLYEKYSNKMSKLESVIFFYSAFTPGLSLVRTSEKYRLVAYKYFFNIPYQDDSLIDKKFEKKIQNRCRKIRPFELNSEYCGYEKKHQFISNLSAAQRAKTHIRENKREPNQLEWLINLIELVKKDEKKLYIVIPPAKKSYMDCLPDKSELFEKLYSLDLSDVIIFDFYGSSIFDDSDLGDFDHMNEKGAKKLTEEIIKNIK
jgi:hypothetical protein